ncbi:MAG TPA: hypothetical protein VJ946_14075 [Bacteroidales bacterium]|nr:hypothetical protein [Bacteroidales bacterium]
MKRIKQLLGTLTIAAALLISPAYANPAPDDDTLRIVVDGDTVSTIDMSEIENMEELENIPDMDSIMKIVEEAMKEVDKSMQDIRIEDFENEKVITITDKDGEVVEKMRIKDEDMEKDNEIEFEFETDDSDKMFYNYFAYDLGMNNYLENQNFPSGDANYYVKPFGSWSVAFETGFRAYATSWFSIDMGADLLWYNFKLQDKSIVTDEGQTIDGEPVITYTDNPLYDQGENDALRSKLTVSYLDLNLMPVFHMGETQGGINKRPLRIGVGGYAGYRIGAHTKNVWDEDGQKRKDKNYDNFYLNNFRYGVKAMIGIKEINIFMNYDLNTLFEKDKGPEGNNLNAFAFGVRFII